MQYMKLSTSRDFRINAATLDAALQEQDDSQEVSAGSAPQHHRYRSSLHRLFSSLDCSVSSYFAFALSLLSDHRVTGDRRDTRAQTEEEETVRRLMNSSCLFGMKAAWSTQSYLPLLREPLVMLMIW